MKKRVLSLILAVVLVCALAVPAMAVTVTEAIPFQYDDARNFSEGLAAVKLNDKWGFIDKTGKVVIPFQYDEVLASGFSEGLAPVGQNGKWGFIDKTGKVVIPYRYSGVYAFSDGLAQVYLNGKGGYIDKTGREVVPLGKYDDTRKFSEGFGLVWTKVNLHSEGGFIDTTGKEVIPLKYGHAFPFSEGLAAVRGLADKNWKWGFIDKTGKEIIPHKYEAVVDGFSEGLAKVAETSSGKSQWGFIDKTGKEVVPCKYETVGNFSEGLAWVVNGKEYGYIDKTGKEVIPSRYVTAWDFSNGLAMVQGENGKGFIDKTGREVVPLGKYNDVRDFSEGLAMVRLNSKWGFLAIDGYNTAYPSTQKVDVDGKAIEFQCYALKEGNGMTNYIKLRDLADILNGSAAQFEVGWSNGVTITTGQGYTKNGSEQKTPFSGNRTYKEATAKTLVDGKAVDLAAFTLTDDNGGGYTYYKLRDLGTALGFKVDWTAERGIFIETK